MIFIIALLALSACHCYITGLWVLLINKGFGALVSKKYLVF